jgi:hypothetical protein
MELTLESERCPNCGTKNSIHIDNCRKCGKALPWAGTEQTRIFTEPVRVAKPEIPRRKVITMYVVGGATFTLGVISTVDSLLRHHAPTGYFWIIWGMIMWKYADNLAMNIDEIPT